MYDLTEENANDKAQVLYKGHKRKVRDTIDSQLFTLSESVQKMYDFGREAKQEKNKTLTKLLDGIVNEETQNTLRNSMWKDIKRKKKTQSQPDSDTSYMSDVDSEM